MCERCCALVGVPEELVGPKVAVVLMKRVRSRMHDAPPSNLSQRELELSSVS